MKIFPIFFGAVLLSAAAQGEVAVPAAAPSAPAATNAAPAVTNAAPAATAAAAAAPAPAPANDSRRKIDTRVFRLNHISAQEVADSINGMFSGEFGDTWKLVKIAMPFPESNTVLVTAPQGILDACEKAILAIDVEAKQVYIEARFVELGSTASHKVGINWTLLDGVTVAGTAGAGLEKYDIGEAVKSYQKRSEATEFAKEAFELASTAKNAGDASIGYFNGTLNISQMSATLKLLDSTEDAKTFSNPKIIVSSGKKATVDMTTKYPNVKISTKRTTGTSDSVDIASNLEPIPGEDKFMFAKEAFFSWGISLEVTPRVGTNGLINVSIVPTISSQEGWVETGTTSSSSTYGTAESGTISSKYPVIKVQRLISEFNLESGTTAVIGGLSITEEKQVDTGIPLLREIPWLGQTVFGSKERVKEQKEIVVFVTVGLVNPRAMPKDAGLPKNAIIGRQYANGERLEPGDMSEEVRPGFGSLDMRPLEEQAKDPLRRKTKPDDADFSFSDYMPFKKDPSYKTK